MRDRLVSYLRFMGFSAVALVIAACVKIAPAEAATNPAEPLFGDPPEAGQTTTPAAQTEEDRIAALEAQVDALGQEIAQLRKALDVLGPLPDQPGMFIPIAQSEITGEAPSDAQDEAAAKLAQLYAPAPKLARANSLFYEAELGSFANKAAAEAQWKKLLAG